MNLLVLSPMWLLWLLTALLAAAAIQDTVQLKIANLTTGLVLALAVLAMIMAGPKIALWQNLVVFLLILGIGTALFSNGILGGGDVKLFAAVALWTDFPGAFRLLFAICLAGGVLALFIIFLRIVIPARAGGRVKTLQKNAGIPYGIAIAAGTLAMVATSHLGASTGTYNPNIPSLDRR